MIYDSDNDGVLTFVQVKNAVNVLGKQIEGKSSNHTYIDTNNCNLDRDLVTNIEMFSDDTKNLSLEFNEFLKMIAQDKNAVNISSCQELIEAFQVFDEKCSGSISKSQLKTILFKIGYCPLQQEDIEDIVKVR